ncbi:hypothetical protein PUR71_38525 [Streptomyces sp. SP17BM10]|uniref:hypothetical protein n=1 Tax=Streptomyces sp. SP17BM10 TaxID=3002530 RepID=UPI002E798AD3|nr:hypothetical protein [Streptomyces sp. SP17BM10]MEE1788756.1 hypothetical protein [Streptomyces sp. SP17BM10]
MSATPLLDRADVQDQPTGQNLPTAALEPSTLLGRDREPSARTCPVRGSGATYQTMDGRWGCTSCGSTWA